VQEDGARVVQVVRLMGWRRQEVLVGGAGRRQQVRQLGPRPLLVFGAHHLHAALQHTLENQTKNLSLTHSANRRKQIKKNE